MFGHTDDQQQTDNNFAQGQPATEVVYSEGQAPNDNATADDSAAQGSAVSSINEIPSASEPSSPVNSSSPFTQPSHTVSDPTLAASDDSASPTIPSAPITPDDNGGNGTTTDHSELLDIKQQALQQLSPLVSHLDQTPEDKFKTTMMMIQASDDHALLPEAYKAAQAITDEKAKAQALLDVVNEINYFTQSS